MIIGVMLAHIHTGFSGHYMHMPNASWLYLNLAQYGMYIITQGCLQALFLISAYLFFVNTPQKWSWDVYGRKMRKRLWTVVLPYIVWNAIFLLDVWLTNLPALRPYFDGRTAVTISWQYIWMSFTDMGESTSSIMMPLDYPLWYLRALFTFCLLAPLLYWLTRKGGIALVLFAAIMTFSGWWPHWAWYICDPKNFLAFTMGLWIALYPQRLMSIWRQWMGWTALIIFVPLSYFWIIAPYWNVDIEALKMLCTLCVLWCGYMAVWHWHLGMPGMLTSSAFLLFAFHVLLIQPIQSVLFRIMGAYEPWHMMALMVLIIICTAGICVAINEALRRWCPGFHRFLTGGR